MKNPRDYLILSTIAGLFSGALAIPIGPGVPIWYLVMLVNFPLMLWVGAFRATAGLLALAGLLLSSGCVGWLQGTDSLVLFSKQFLGIMTSALYFSCFFKLADDDVQNCFRRYVRGAYYVAWLGIFLLPLQAILAAAPPRLHSVLDEPATYAIVTLPALYYCLDRYRSERTHGKELFVFLVALLLSQSSVGFLGLLLSMALLFGRSWKTSLAGAMVVVGSAAALYCSSPAFRVRADDTTTAIQANSVEQTNLSTFALLSNAMVTQKVLQEHPLAGNGLGSHLLSHGKYISDVPGIEFFHAMILHGRQTMDELNAADANSLLLRILSEMGILGLVITLAFIARFRIAGAGPAAAISGAILVYFAAKLLRAGHYFTPEVYFFGVAYCINRPGTRRAVN